MTFSKFFTLAAVLPLVFATPAPLVTSTTSAAAARQTHQIHPSSNTSECLTVFNPTNDAPVWRVSCNETSESGNQTNTFNYWVFVPGDNMSIRLNGWGLCLDAGVSPHNNVTAKVYECYPGLEQQHWYYTNDQRIAITGGNQCLDYGASGTDSIQTFQCSTGDNAQAFPLTDIA